MLEHEHVVHWLAGAQGVTGALSAFDRKGTLGRAMFELSLSRFVNSGKVDQSSVPKHLFANLNRMLIFQTFLSKIFYKDKKFVI